MGIERKSSRCDCLAAVHRPLGDVLASDVENADVVGYETYIHIYVYSEDASLAAIFEPRDDDGKEEDLRYWNVGLGCWLVDLGVVVSILANRQFGGWLAARNALASIAVS